MRFPCAHLFSNLLWMLLASMSLNAAEPTDGSIDSSSQRPRTTYERFLPLAVAGDPAIQNFLGYMFFHGEGVDLNYEEAHYWFHAAAEEGDALAQRNLGIFHSRAIDRIPEKYYDAAEANLWFSLAAANPENTEYSPNAAQAYQQFLPAASD
ncbi:MAG: sel1 repeat family protein, partial [Gammaproteobacteria bacterium]